MPYGLKMLVDVIAVDSQQFNNKSILKDLLPPVLLILGSWTLMTILLRITHYWESFVIPKFESSIRMKVFNHVIGHNFYFFTDNMVGNIAGKISDLPTACNSILKIFSWNVVSTIFILISSCFILMTVHYSFTLIVLGWCVVHITLVIFYSKKVDKASSAHAENQSILNGAITDEISNISSIKSHIYDFQKNSIVNQFQQTEIYSHHKLIKQIVIFEIILDFPMFLLLSLTLFFLVKNWQLGFITPGDFVLTFNIVLAVMYNVLGLGSVLIEIYKETGRIKQSINLLLNPEPATLSIQSKELKVTVGRIEFKEVKFSYTENIGKLNADHNLIIEGGSMVGIVGNSGSGKSSFINLIMGFYKPKIGLIKIDGQNICEISEDSLRSNISYVSQEVVLFHRSIKENIRFGKQDATDEEIQRVAKLTQCHEFISNLPDSYETIVGDKGSKLSGGQRQLIVIARAILKDAPILILDEATSALDSITEASISHALELYMKQKTVIIVAHRLSTISKLRRILVFDKGQVIEDGTHQDLINKNGLYNKMWYTQRKNIKKNC